MYTHLAAATAAVADRLVTSASMKVGAYTIANASAAWAAGFRVTVTHTAVDAADSLGTITVTGTDLAGQGVSEVITPLAGSVATSAHIFASVTSATGAGWVIGGGNDTITIGHAAGAYLVDGSGALESVVVNTTAAGAVTVSDARGTLAVLKASVVEGSYEYDAEVAGWLKVDLAAASDVTVTHTPTQPKTYAMA